MSLRHRKKRTHVRDVIEEDEGPRTVIIVRGKCAPELKDLMGNLRRVWEPRTATNLKFRKSNTLNDLVKLSVPLKISHMLVLSTPREGATLKFLRLQDGPSLIFRVKQYSNMSDIARSQKRPVLGSTRYITPALCILNGFKRRQVFKGKTDGYIRMSEDVLAIVSRTIQNSFPPIKVNEISISACQRVVLFQRNAETDLIEMRHYAVRLEDEETFLERKLKKKADYLGKFDSFEDFLEHNPNFDYDAEFDTTDVETETEDESDKMPKPSIKINQKNQRIRLVEIGPRISLELIKILDGLLDGNTIYHRYISDMDEERARQQERMREAEAAAEAEGLPLKLQKTEE
ncbi:hypothetical protein PCE1_004886 [Barthelona sp. PCE]